MQPPSFFYKARTAAEPVGPVSLDELHAAAAGGEISRNSPVILEGTSEWGRYSDHAVRPGRNGVTPPQSSLVDRFLALNFRFGKVIAVVLATIFLFLFGASLLYALFATSDSVTVPTFDELRPRNQTVSGAARDFSDLDEKRAVEKKFGDDVTDIVKAYGLRSGDYDEIMAALVALPQEHRKDYVRGLRRVLSDREAFVKKNAGSALPDVSQLTQNYTEAFARSVANAVAQRTVTRVTRLVAFAIAAAACLAAFIMMTIPAILMIEQHTRRLAAG